MYFSAEIGKTSRLLNLTLQIDERVTNVAVSSDSMDGVMVGNRGSVWVTTDGGERWTPSRLNLNDDERVTKLNFVASREDRVDTTKEKRSETAKEGRQPVDIATFPSGIFVIETSGGNTYLLRRYPELTNWAIWSPARTLSALMDIETLRDDPIIQRMSSFVARAATVNAREANTQKKEEGSGNGRNWWPLDDLTIMRIVTSTILFFLVQLLVRLYQYSLRLASFWESRADAVLLSESFAETKSERFEDLVNALAPDGYDFKAMPRSPLDWLWRRNRIPNVQT